ncbi:SEN34 subunit of tRNA-splicing endonuclease [Choiromyces venosus 120613-1]|uniref:tRNA-splicing endonuclease subunit Sen34 n=1 Tax=Choiromyces venosus 120613-1 TaxID=1336337 RepID=A0A3N4K4S9_9PEZI|nr:SEN34 subunit of tRNA-splicing endonuclease [Choiromyces venosus 120613-1]
MATPKIPEEPFPIYLVSSRYFLYDADVISHVRRIHRMCGCLTGTLPQIPQQNVFLGLPLELMSEEALLLVEKGAGYIVDDVRTHECGLRDILEEDKKAYLEDREEGKRRGAEEYVRRMEEKKNVFVRERNNDDGEAGEGEAEDGVEGETVFENSSTSNSKAASTIAAMAANAVMYYPTASTSHQIYHCPPDPSSTEITAPLPERTQGYPLYKHLHENGYFLSPGLRFGAQYMAYPGDPLRFHSHFVVNGLGWDDEIDMRDVVGGGRLGTGVKKAWMVGGEDEEGKVRTFCIEWGGF